jgi:hypothetical protein
VSELWLGDEGPPDPQEAAIKLVALLLMSNEAEAERDPFARRMRLNEMQAAIQAAKPRIEAFAEGLLFTPDDGDAAAG